MMKLIVGLGNPGIDYEKTRHNTGFILLDYFVKEMGLTYSNKMNGMYAKGVYNDQTYIVLKPLFFMNLSGTVVKKYIDYYKIDIKDVLIIQDDLDLPFGKIKIKAKGSCGGHNGIRNIIDNLQNENFGRIKVGISKVEKNLTIDYVLGKFNNEEFEKIAQICELSSKILKDFLVGDINKIMSKYNGVEYEIK